jgi:hypothetical protein
VRQSWSTAAYDKLGDASAPTPYLAKQALLWGKNLPQNQCKRVNIAGKRVGVRLLGALSIL